MSASHCQFIQCLLGIRHAPAITHFWSICAIMVVMERWCAGQIQVTQANAPKFSEGRSLAALSFYIVGFVGLILSPFGTTENSSALGLRWVSSYTASSST